MRLGERLNKTLTAMMAGAALFTTSACGQPERVQTVGDFCPNSQRISAEPHPSRNNQTDPDNVFDTDQTVAEILAHNEVFDELCPPSE